MSVVPLQIRALSAEKALEVVWGPGDCRRYPFVFLRGVCPCANCINEWTGERILDLETIPETIAPSGIQFSGNYALKIQWNDGHSTGLYSWEMLKRLSTADEVTACPEK